MVGDQLACGTSWSPREGGKGEIVVLSWVDLRQFGSIVEYSINFKSAAENHPVVAVPLGNKVLTRSDVATDATSVDNCLCGTVPISDIDLPSRRSRDSFPSDFRPIKVPLGIGVVPICQLF